MYRYCDCKDWRGEINLYKANNGRNKMRTTETDKNGVCLFCGHHTIENRNILTHTKASVDHNVSKGELGVSGYLR